MRRILLWMGGNRWLRRNVPRLWFVRRAVRRFMPGEAMEDALAAAARFEQQGFGVLFTHLGENLTRLADADRTADHYVELIEEAHRRGLATDPSVKLTHLGLDMDVERTFANAARLAQAAQANGGRTMWIDMEGSDYTESTIALYERLKKDHPNVGLCLQAYLKRTYMDVQRLLPVEPRVRLVKGAYAEPVEICFQRDREVDANFLALCVSMLEARRQGRSLELSLGTHDVRLIEQVADHAQSIGLPRTELSVDMLYGIRAGQQRRLRKEGYKVSVLIAYGSAWYPWYMRRLAERPANVLFALRSLLPVRWPR